MSTYIKEISRHCGFRGKPGCHAQQRGNEMRTLKNEIYGQLARTNLLPDSESSEILAGHGDQAQDISRAAAEAQLEKFRHGEHLHAVVERHESPAQKIGRASGRA